MIDASTISTSKSINELYFISSLSQFQTYEFKNAVKILFDKVFKHRIILKNETVVMSLTSYIFNISVDDCYYIFEFKRLLIDSDAVIRSTEDISQMKTLQRIDDSVKLDKSTIESINFTFEIESTAFIDSIMLHISIERITFHIVLINTSFLLCLVDLNKLRAYFNNTINQIVRIKTNQFYSVIRRYDHAFLL